MSAEPKMELRPLQPDDERAFRLAHEAAARRDPPWEFGFQVRAEPDFAAYVRWTRGWAAGRDIPGHFVPNTYLVAVIGNEIVGRTSIRHRLNAQLMNIGGHVGYGVTPSREGQGVATEILRLSLPICLELGLDRILVTCDQDNIPSRRVIEKNGGEFENAFSSPELPVPKLRYWIDIQKQLSL